MCIQRSVDVILFSFLCLLYRGPEGSQPLFFFFQAEDGIRDFHVTGVQTCALPILDVDRRRLARAGRRGDLIGPPAVLQQRVQQPLLPPERPEAAVERGKERREVGALQQGLPPGAAAAKPAAGTSRGTSSPPPRCRLCPIAWTTRSPATPVSRSTARYGRTTACSLTLCAYR